MNNKILVVEKKNGKIIKKYYITKKEAQKHMSERHKRLDRYRQGEKKEEKAAEEEERGEEGEEKKEE